MGYAKSLTIIIDGDSSYEVTFRIYPTDPTIDDLSGEVVKVAVAPPGTVPAEDDYTDGEWAGPLTISARFGVGGLNPDDGVYRLYGKPYDNPNVEPQAAEGVIVIVRPT